MQRRTAGATGRSKRAWGREAAVRGEPRVLPRAIGFHPVGVLIRPLFSLGTSFALPSKPTEDRRSPRVAAFLSARRKWAGKDSNL
jgi:hypothetical protein